MVLTFSHTSIKIELTTVDTSWYRDALNLGDSFERVSEYITALFRRAMKADAYTRDEQRNFREFVQRGLHQEGFATVHHHLP